MKPSAYVLAIDQGTTGSRAILLNQEGAEVGRGYEEIEQFYPHPGWVEHDPVGILRSVRKAISQAFAGARETSRRVEAIGITNQRESIVFWNRKTGKPYHRVIVWQDRRTAGLCDTLKKRKLEPLFHSKTGLVLDPYFSGTKIHWLFTRYPHLKSEAKRGNLVAGTIDSWLLWNLTGEHVTDPTNASRTLLFNIQHRKWDDELLHILDVPTSILPRVSNSGSIFGKTKNGFGLPEGIPVAAMLGDQQAALYGQACYRRGDMKNTYGTGCFLVINTGSAKVISKRGLLTTLACDEKGKPSFALEGSVFIAGALIQWIRDSLKWIRHARESEKIARSVPNSGGVTVIPAFVGLGAPYWDAHARGAILGLTRGVKSAHIIRAALESIAFQTADLVHVIRKEFKFPIHSLKVDGGASQNDFLMQFQSDLLDVNVLRSARVESTAWGVGKLAGVTCGLWKSVQAMDKQMNYRKFRPRMKKEIRFEALNRWQNQVKRVLTQPLSQT